MRGKVDNLDGSYTIRITEVPNNVKSEDLSISVMGEEMAMVHCKLISFWHLAILVILIFLIYQFKQSKVVYIALRVLAIIWILFVLLKYFGIICINFL